MCSCRRNCHWVISSVISCQPLTCAMLRFSFSGAMGAPFCGVVELARRARSAGLDLPPALPYNNRGWRRGAPAGGPGEDSGPV